MAEDLNKEYQMSKVCDDTIVYHEVTRKYIAVVVLVKV